MKLEDKGGRSMADELYRGAITSTHAFLLYGFFRPDSNKAISEMIQKWLGKIKDKKAREDMKRQIKEWEKE